MTVLDASAVLALIHDEAGSDVVATHIAGTALGAANLAEVVDTLVDAEIDVARLRGLLAAASVIIEPLTAADAELAGAMRSLEGAARCRSATGAALRSPSAVTPPRCSQPSVPGPISTFRSRFD